MNHTSKNIAKHFKEVNYGVNWTWANLNDSLQGITWKQATKKIGDFNTIAALVFHIDYFVAAAIEVLEGRPLNAHDKYSFDVPEINSEKDWENLKNKVWTNADKFIELVAQLPDDKLWETFADEKYGIYYRNLAGTIEHTHYHLGQINILKKLL